MTTRYVICIYLLTSIGLISTLQHLFDCRCFCKQCHKWSNKLFL